MCRRYCRHLCVDYGSVIKRYFTYYSPQKLSNPKKYEDNINDLINNAKDNYIIRQTIVKVVNSNSLLNNYD